MAEATRQFGLGELGISTSLISDLHVHETVEQSIYKFLRAKYASEYAEGEDFKLFKEQLFEICLKQPFYIPMHIHTGSGTRPTVIKPKLYLPGHDLKDNKHYGPRKHRYDVVVIGKMPAEEEIKQLRNFVGPSGDLLRSWINKHLPQVENIYVTNICKVFLPEVTTLTKDYLILFQDILTLELRLTKPKFILALGADAFKVFRTSKTGRFSDWEAKFLQYTIDLPNKDPHQCLIYCMKHPVNAIRNPDLVGNLEQTFVKFANYVKENLKKIETEFQTQRPPSFEIIKDFTKVEQEFAKARKHFQSKVPVVLDCEWHGQWFEKDFFMRYIQIGIPSSNDDLKIFILDCVANRDLVIQFIDFLIKNKSAIRLIGHSIVADMVALCGASGKKPYQFYEILVPPKLDKLSVALFNNKPEGFMKELQKAAATTKTDGVFDTMLAAHALNESMQVNLKFLSSVYLNFPQYDYQLQQYIQSSKMSISEEEKAGFGFVPEEILAPYAAWDIQATYYLYKKFNEELLEKDSYGNWCRLPFYISSLTIFPYLEAQYYGIHIDSYILKVLHQTFEEKASEILNEIRSEINWPEFSGKGLDRREFVYGFRPDMKVRRSPPAAQLLNLEPLGEVSNFLDDIEDTDEDTKFENKKSSFNLSSISNSKTPYVTNQQALAILFRKNQDHPRVHLLSKFRDWCLLNGSLERVLREDIKAGLLKYAQIENIQGRTTYTLHPTYLPILKTGRSCSIKPNLQNLSKKREDDYKRILKDKYIYPTRTIVRARNGFSLLEFDFISAELMVLAIVSGDEKLEDLCRRSLLPKDHPDYLDIHSFLALKLIKRTDLPPVKEKLIENNLGWLRDAIKTAIYGLVYGQTAQKFYIQCQINGIPISSQEEAERFIQFIENEFPVLMKFIKESCHDVILNHGYIFNPFGRFRRFSVPPKSTFKDYKTYDKTISTILREGVNFIPQSTVADLISLSMGLITYVFREFINYSKTYKFNEGLRLLIQIHDALLYEVEYELADKIELIVKKIMSSLPVQKNFISNSQPAFGYLGAESHRYNNWGLDLNQQAPTIPSSVEDQTKLEEEKQ